MVILPVPWEITVSYHTGTSSGPESILKASSQIDVYVNDIPDAWKLGVAMLPIPQEIWEEMGRISGATGEVRTPLPLPSLPPPPLRCLSTFSLFLIAILTWILRPDLLKPSIVSGILVVILFFLVYKGMQVIFPSATE